MWTNATSSDDLKPGVRFRCYWGSREAGSNFAYEGLIVHCDDKGQTWKMLNHGYYKLTPIGGMKHTNHLWINCHIWVDEEQSMEEFLNKLFTVINREWASGRFCSGGIQDLFNDVIAPCMAGRKDVEKLKKDIVDWIDYNHDIDEYKSYLDELGIDYQKIMEVVVNVPRSLNFDADDFREWLEEHCGDHTYMLDIRRV